jgi:hypothetical protein
MKMRETFYDSVEALHADLDAWLVLLQHQAPPLGYRNMGRRPRRPSCHSLAKKVEWTDQQRTPRKDTARLVCAGLIVRQS